MSIHGRQPDKKSFFLGGIFIVAIPMSFLWARIALRISTIRAAIISSVLYLLITPAFLFDNSAVSVIITGLLLGVPIAGFLVLLNILLDFRMLLGGLPLVFLLFAILLLIRYQRLLKQPAQPLVLGEQGHDAGKLSQVGDD